MLVMTCGQLEASAKNHRHVKSVGVAQAPAAEQVRKQAGGLARLLDRTASK
jgi:hypothetical protein